VWRVICASHAYKLAQQISGKFLRIVSSDWYRRHRLRRAEVGRDTGRRHAIGVGGALTGLRANGGIVDDSLNAIHATSKLGRRYAAGFTFACRISAKAWAQAPRGDVLCIANNSGTIPELQVFAFPIKREGTAAEIVARLPA
jgi:hypothetical protein